MKVLKLLLYHERIMVEDENKIFIYLFIYFKILFNNTIK